MKTFSLLFAFIFITSYLQAQIVPFTFVTPGETKTGVTDTFTTKADSVTVVSIRKRIHLNWKRNNKFTPSHYSYLAENALQKAAEIKIHLEDECQRKLKEVVDKIIATTDPNERKLLKMRMKQVEAERKSVINGQYKDMLNLVKEMNYYHLTRKNLKLFPVRNAVGAQLYYENEQENSRNKFLQNTLIRYSPDGGKASMFNEIFSDYGGAFRFGIGLLVSNKSGVTDVTAAKKDSLQQEDAIQRLIGGGGNFVINAGYPIAGFIDQSDNFSAKLVFAPKANIDVPKLGTEKERTAVSGDIGIEGTVFYTMSNNVITLFSNYRFGYIFGNSNFYENLLKTDKKAFFLNQVSTGIALSSTFRITWNVFFGSAFVRSNFNQSIGFSIVPK